MIKKNQTILISMYLPVCEKCFWKDIKNLGRGLEWLGKGQGHFVGVEVGGKLETLVLNLEW